MTLSVRHLGTRFGEGKMALETTRLQERQGPAGARGGDTRTGVVLAVASLSTAPTRVSLMALMENPTMRKVDVSTVI
jgi:hypothetical protein